MEGGGEEKGRKAERVEAGRVEVQPDSKKTGQHVYSLFLPVIPSFIPSSHPGTQSP